MGAVLELNNITKYFSARCVVDNISLTINEGEIVGFLGPNGSGKPTTIKMIAGLLFPDKGSIIINGYDTVSYTHLPAHETLINLVWRHFVVG